MFTLKTKWFSVTWGKVAPQTKAYKDAIFFDAGRRKPGRTCVRVTDFNGKPYQVESPEGVWEKSTGNLVLPEGRNVPYGELMGCFLALKVGLKNGSKYVVGDHEGVINTWSRSISTAYLRREENAHVRSLAEKTSDLRKRFEDGGGEVARIRSTMNPADVRWW